MSQGLAGTMPADVHSRDIERLVAAAAAAWGVPAAGVTLLRHEPNAFESTFRSGFVTFRLPGGTARRAFYKHAVSVPAAHGAGGHHGGVAYEAAFYARVLAPLTAARLTVPRFYGSHVDPATGEAWLFVEALDGAAAISKQDDPADAQARAAEWLGRFHAAHEGRDDSLRDAIRAYDTAYFAQWAARTAAFTRERHAEMPWLPALCERFERVTPLLCGRADTVVHGEYYPANVLWWRGAVYPVDWESAALASGEIDLASLCEQWPDDHARDWARAYAAARWPGRAPPDDFGAALDAARLYFHLRWLGNRPEVTRTLRTWRYDDMRRLGGRLGLV